MFGVHRMSDTQDSLEIRPPQASIRNKDRLKRSRPERIRYEEDRVERRQRKDSHRKSHHRQREHHRGEHGGREKRHHRERREGKERDRERTHAERREHKRRLEGPPELMSLPNPHIEDLRNHLERRDKGERRSDGGKEHHRERREKVMEEPPEKKPPPETPQQKEERLQKERRIERFLHAGLYGNCSSGWPLFTKKSAPIPFYFYVLTCFILSKVTFELAIE